LFMFTFHWSGLY